MTNAIDVKAKNETLENQSESQEQTGNKIQSRILSKLFDEINKEKISDNGKVNPRAQYVRGGVYHKQYNRYS